MATPPKDFVMPEEWRKRLLEILESGATAFEMLTKLGMKADPIDSPTFDWGGPVDLDDTVDVYDDELSTPSTTVIRRRTYREIIEGDE